MDGGFDNQSESQKLTTYLINNTAIYIIVYVVMLFLYQVATALMANWNGITTLVYPYKIHFFIKWYQWRLFSVVTVFSIGPLLCLFLGLIFVPIQYVLQRFPGKLKTVTLFAFLHGFNFFFGALIAGVIEKSGFAYTIIWGSYVLGVSEIIKVILAGIFSIILLVIGFYARKPFLQTTASISLLEEAGTGKFVSYALVGPWLLGSAVVTGIHAPNFNYYYIWQFATFFLMMIPILVYHSDDDQYLVVREPEHRVSLLYVSIAIVCLFFSRFVHGGGLNI